jgi:transposase
MQIHNKSKLVFKTYTPNQTLLFPSNLEELIDQHHPVRVVNQIIDQINIDPLLARFKGGGASSYHPRMLLKVLVYAYLNNIFTSRKMEAAIKENIHFMWLSGMNKPDHNTLNRFRSDRLKGVLEEIFAQLVELLVDQGLINLKEIYTDGTKMEANANRYSFVWGKSVNNNKERIRKQLKQLWQYTEKIAAEELADTEPIEFEKLDAQVVTKTIEKIDKALAEKPVDEKINKKITYAKKHWPSLVTKYNEQQKVLAGRNSYSKTDQEATFMRMKEDQMGNGQLKPAYNLQISSSNQFIVNYSLHQHVSDTNTLQPHLEQFEKLYKKLPDAICTDGGYGSEANYEFVEGKGIKNFIKYNFFHKEQKEKFRQDPSRAENLFYNESTDCLYCPMGQPMEKIDERDRINHRGYCQTYSIYQAKNCHNCPMRGPCHKGKDNRIVEINHKLRKYKQNVRENLLSEEGRRHRRKRPVDVEPVFGCIKHNKGYRKFLLRGLKKVEIEMGLLAIAHNLAKLSA